MAKEQPITTIELDPDVWLRGGDNAALLTTAPDGRRQQCCIGVACTALGVTDDQLAGVGMLEDIPQWAIPVEFGNVITERENDDGSSWIVDVLADVYRLNDSEQIKTDAERVEAINIALAKLSASIRFSLKDERRAVAATDSSEQSGSDRRER